MPKHATAHTQQRCHSLRNELKTKIEIKRKVMTKEFKKTIYYSSIYIILYLLSTGILLLLFNDITMIWIIPIATVIAYIFSPRFKEIQTQSGTKYQVKWIFMKKTIMI